MSAIDLAPVLSKLGKGPYTRFRLFVDELDIGSTFFKEHTARDDNHIDTSNGGFRQFKGFKITHPEQFELADHDSEPE